ncbi:hypothetical protein H8957_001872 [Semnopithecus entellus]
MEIAALVCILALKDMATLRNTSNQARKKLLLLQKSKRLNYGRFGIHYHYAEAGLILQINVMAFQKTDFHCWIGITVFLLFVLTLLRNSVIIVTVKLEPGLQQPMYFFLCMLAVSDMALASSTAPKMLGILWFDAPRIDFNICLTQLYFSYIFCVIESAILVAMAFDHFVAICIPLCYTTMLSTPMVVKIGLVDIIRAIFMVLPHLLFISKLQYYTKCVINDAYCEHMAVRLAHASIFINRVYGISVALSVMILDLGPTATSCIKILQAVFHLSSQNTISKSMGTCATHVCTILFCYIPTLFSFLIHCIVKKESQNIGVDLLSLPHFLHLKHSITVF